MNSGAFCLPWRKYECKKELQYIIGYKTYKESQQSTYYDEYPGGNICMMKEGDIITNTVIIKNAIDAAWTTIKW